MKSKNKIHRKSADAAKHPHRARQKPMLPKTDMISTIKTAQTANAQLNKEIEKKFLIREDGENFVSGALLKMFPSVDALIAEAMRKGKPIKQGYLSIGIGKEIAEQRGIKYDFYPKEARIREKAGVFYFTMKGEGGLTRDEIKPDVKIPRKLFLKNWQFTKGHKVEKMRLEKRQGNLTLEFDVYLDRDLIVAEIEYDSEKEAQLGPVLGKDVTEDQRYKNKNLAK